MKELIIGQIPDTFDPDIHIPISPICFIGKENIYPSFDAIEFIEFSKINYNYSELDEVINWEAIHLMELFVKHFFEKDYGNYSIRFWKALFYPWVGLFVPFLYRKQVLVEKVIENYKEQELKVVLPLVDLKNQFHFLDINDFIENGIRNILFNEYIISLFLSKMAPSNWKLIYKPKITSTPKNFESNKIKHIQKRTIERIIDKWLYRSKLTYGFNHLDRVLIDFLLKLKRPIKTNSKHDSFPKRESVIWHIDIQNILISFIPKKLVECDISSPPRKYRKGKIVNYSNSLYFNSSSRLDSAFAYENGEIVIATQHGGHTYGSAATSEFVNSIEYSADYFISWGWKNYKNKYLNNVIVLPSPLLSKILNTHVKRTEDIIFVGTVMNLYLDKFDSWMNESESLAYRKNKLEFIKAFKTEMGLDNLLYKPYNEKECFLQDSKYLQKHIPELKTLNSNVKEFHNQLKSASFLILDHPGTTMNIAMSMNIPLILFWSKEWFLFNKQSLLYLDKFEKLGIFHENPLDAIQKIKEIQKQAGGTVKWWSQEEIQNLRRDWLQEYAYVEKNWRKHWLSSLLNLS